MLTVNTIFNKIPAVSVILTFFPLISPSDNVCLIMKIIGQCGDKHIMMLPVKTIKPVLKVLTYTITSITPPPIRFDLDIHFTSITPPYQI